MKLAGCELKGRTGHEAGRALLADLYREETGEEMPEIAVTDRGKPYFPGSGWHFSISPTKRHAVCVLSRRNVGLDAEETDRDIDLRLAEKILSPAEKARFDAAAHRRTALLRLWVLKESYAKLTGRGLGNYLKDTDFSPEDPRIQVIDGCYVAVLEEP